MRGGITVEGNFAYHIEPECCIKLNITCEQEGEGSDDLELEGKGSGDLELEGEGSGDLELVGEGSGDLELVDEGSGDLELEGEGSGDLELVDEGSGNLEWCEEGSGDLELVDEGSGDLEWCEEGSGDLYTANSTTGTCTKLWIDVTYCTAVYGSWPDSYVELYAYYQTRRFKSKWPVSLYTCVCIYREQSRDRNHGGIE